MPLTHLLGVLPLAPTFLPPGHDCHLAQGEWIVDDTSPSCWLHACSTTAFPPCCQQLWAPTWGISSQCPSWAAVQLSQPGLFTLST